MLLIKIIILYFIFLFKSAEEGISYYFVAQSWQIIISDFQSACHACQISTHFESSLQNFSIWLQEGTILFFCFEGIKKIFIFSIKYPLC